MVNLYGRNASQSGELVRSSSRHTIVLLVYTIVSRVYTIVSRFYMIVCHVTRLRLMLHDCVACLHDCVTCLHDCVACLHDCVLSTRLCRLWTDCAVIGVQVTALSGRRAWTGACRRCDVPSACFSSWRGGRAIRGERWVARLSLARRRWHKEGKYFRRLALVCWVPDIISVMI